MNRAARVFISYRRNDTKWAAGRLYDRLAAVLGAENVFLDVSNIEPGKDFVLEIKEVVGTCDVFLAMIGEHWLESAGDSTSRRIDNQRDLIRVEVATALERNIRVIPILVDNATLPDEDALPTDLASLARRNARQVSFESFHSDMDSFIRVLERILAGPSAKPQNVAEAKNEQREGRSSGPLATNLPFTVSLATLGGVATPLIRRGTKLPAEATEVFSTAADDQSSVEIKLFAGERKQTTENVLLGTFQLGEIEPAPRGVPQIQLRATVDPSLVLVVTAENKSSGQKKVLDAVDLSQVQVPPSATQAETTDLPGFGDIFSQFFGNTAKPDSKGNLDSEVPIIVTKAFAKSGGERTITGPRGQIRVRLPAGMRTGSRLRIQGQGRQEGSIAGDLYITITVDR